METKDLNPLNWFKNNRKGSNLSFKNNDNDSWMENFPRSFDDFSREFNNLENYFLKLFREHNTGNLKLSPKVDLSEGDKEYIIEADLPGVKEEDIDISLTNSNILVLKAKKETVKEHKERDYYNIERTYGTFERSISLPDNADAEKINAKFKNGVLEVKIPKNLDKESAHKKIPLGK